MKPRSRIPLFATILLLASSPSVAQEIDVKRAWVPVGGQSAKSEVEPERIHITDLLLRSPEGVAALREYISARNAGLLSTWKRSAVADTIGQERDFNVLTNVNIDSTRKWTSMAFTLRSTNDVANVWVETELDGTFSAENMSELENFILSETPEDSYRSDRGVIENNNDTFGAPPNVDGDGRVDILLHDIEEGEGAGCCVLGYVSTADLSPHPSSSGNQRDVLYVDLPDGLAGGGVVAIAGFIAHEYQHLIHFAYWATPELAFVNEGLSEWASVVNGFFIRTIDYLQDTAEHNTSLLDFRLDESIAVTDIDYQRSGLFTTYLADRIGREATGSIVQATLPNSSTYAVGAEGYEVVLQEHDLLLADVVADFHTANYVKDDDFDPRFGYSLPQRQTFGVTPTTELDGTGQTSASTTVSVRGGAVHYLRWANVADLQLDVADALSDDGDPRAKTRFRLFAESVEGQDQLVDLSSDVTTHHLGGDFRRVTLIIANVDVQSDTQVTYTVSSDWSTGSGAIAEQTVAYENGKTAGQPYFTLQEATIQASRFEVPQSGRLAAVYVAPVYTNQFVDSTGQTLLPAGLPRDFRLHVWADDGTGLPGEELFSKGVVGDPTGTHLNFGSLEYSFLEVPLDDPVLNNLPDTIYIGISNTGSDENYVVLTTASLIGEQNRSFLLLGVNWVALDEVVDRETQEPLLNGRVLPIRAQFLVATADEDEHELPSSASLAQNYPNPFNPSTSIEYTLPRTMHVRLAVYDVLGRQVVTVVDGIRPAGSHTSVVDASDWSSGAYFYMLETADRSFTRQMIVLK